MASLAPAIRWLEQVNHRLGLTVAWLAIFMVLTQFVVVVLRYVFNMGFVVLQESIWYQHGILFMLGAGFTLLRDGHVRVDIFYRAADPKRKAWVDLLGVVFFLIPVCLLILHFSWSYVLNAWAVHERSTETGGIPAIYLLKTVIWGFVALVLLQGVALAMRSLMVINDETPPPIPGRTPTVTEHGP